nr:hypothetical protein HUO10_006442 [Paraburkholderia busanensis]
MNEELLLEFLAAIGVKDDISLGKFTLSMESVISTVTAVGSAVASTLTAVISGVKSTAEEMERLHYAAQNTGESVGNIMALRYAAGQIGLTADQAQKSLEGFASALRTDPKKKGLLDRLGVKGGSPTEQFEGFVGKLETMPPAKAAKYAKEFGIEPDTLEPLEKGLPTLRASQDKYRAKLDTFGINPDQAAQAGTSLDNTIRDLSTDINLFWVVCEQHLAPVLQKVAAGFERWVSGHADQIAGKMATALEAVADWANKVNWGALAKEADAFLKSAWEVVKVIGAIFGAFSWAAKLLAPDSKKGKDDAPDPSQNDNSVTGRIKRGIRSAWKWMNTDLTQPPESDDAPARQSEKPVPSPPGTSKDLPASPAGPLNRLDRYRGHLQRTLVAYHLGSGDPGKDIAAQGPGWANFLPDETGNYLGRFDSTRLGADTTSSVARSVNLSQQTDVHVYGSPDPHGTARAVAGEQGRVNADIFRNLTGAYV